MAALSTGAKRLLTREQDTNRFRSCHPIARYRNPWDSSLVEQQLTVNTIVNSDMRNQQKFLLTLRTT
jgi:hypothetical protein